MSEVGAMEHLKFEKFEFACYSKAICVILALSEGFLSDDIDDQNIRFFLWEFVLDPNIRYKNYE